MHVLSVPRFLHQFVDNLLVQKRLARAHLPVSDTGKEENWYMSANGNAFDDLPHGGNLRTIGEAAEELGISARTVRWQIQTGKLQSERRFGRRLVILPERINAEALPLPDNGNAPLPTVKPGKVAKRGTRHPCRHHLPYKRGKGGGSSREVAPKGGGSPAIRAVQ